MHYMHYAYKNMHYKNIKKTNTYFCMNFAEDCFSILKIIVRQTIEQLFIENH